MALNRSAATRLRGVWLALLAALIALRPLVSAESNAACALIGDMLILIGAFAVLALASPRRLSSLRTVRIPLLLWMAALILSVARHGADAASLGDRVALAGGPLLCCAAATSWGIWRYRILQAAFLVTAAIAVFAILQYLVILPDLTLRSLGATQGSSALLYEVASRGRVFGTFTLPILLAAYLSMVIPLVLWALHRARTSRRLIRASLWAVLLLTAEAWILTRSIGALFSLTAACAVVWLRRGVRRRSLMLSATALLLVSGLVLTARRDLWDYASPHHPIHNRLVYWDAALHLITTHPIQGVGPGQFAKAYRQTTTAPQLHVRHAHNTYLQIWTEYGLLAIVSWCWLLIALLRKTASLSPWLAVAIWVLPLSNLVDFSLYIPQVSTLWWYLAGWALRSKRHP